MTISAKSLFDAQYAANAAATLYQAPASAKTIIDKFTATNTDSSSRTVTIYVVPSGGNASGPYTIYDALSIAAHTAVDLTVLQNHILGPGDFISALASVASKVVVRASGREITT